jgi:LPS-assembly protein
LYRPSTNRPNVVATRAVWLLLIVFAPGVHAAPASGDELHLELSQKLTTNGAPIDVMARHVELSRTAPSVLEGDVEVRTGDRYLGADRVQYDPVTGDMQAEGNVRFGDHRVEVSGTMATFDSTLGGGQFSDTIFKMKGADGRGKAEKIERVNEDVTVLEGVSYTACPEERDDWVLRAPWIELDRSTQVGVARKARVDFKGVPILYLPYLSFPLSTERKSGFLLPNIGVTERSGTDISVPYYLNLRPNIDMTLTPRYLSRRGLQLASEVRYLSPRSGGNLVLEYLPNDDELDSDRRLASLDHVTRFSESTDLTANIATVSDGNYFQDLGRSLSAASITHLERRVDLDWHDGPWRVLGRLQNFQTLDDEITRDERPYERVPQLLALGSWPDAFFGLHPELRTELVNFERNDGVTGQRLDLLPQLSMPLGTQGFRFTPSAALEHTRYALAGTAAGEPDELTRTAPIVTMDAHAVFERAAGKSQRVQTLEPRARYTWIPLRAQDDFPVFDTGEPDFNLVQLFRDNRFTGTDRLGDADQLAVGVTSRLLDGATGEEYLTATVGELVYFEDRDVTLPDQAPATEDLSDLLAEVSLRVSERWNADIGYQWDPDSQLADKSAVRVQYRTPGRGVLNLGYRFRRAELEQTDVAFALPVGSRFDVVARWNYALDEKETLERFLGFEYRSCCWTVRLVTRRYVSTRSGDTETAIFAQLELKGLTAIGSPTDDLLEHGILGYSR